MFKKLEEAQANYPMWVAAIAGKLGEATPDGFVLADPAIQVFEKKPKDPKEAVPEQKGLSSNCAESAVKDLALTVPVKPQLNWYKTD